MSATTIPWTDFTFNPWWGCVEVSPACVNCYARAWAKRCGFDVWGKHAGRRFFGAEHFEEPLRWNAAAARDGVRRRVFVASMADVFEWPRSLALVVEMGFARARLWDVIEQCRSLDWLLLTKRPENFWLAPYGRSGARSRGPWPENVWLGVTAEDQKRADERIPLLLRSGAKTLFVSNEPALELVDFTSVAGVDALSGWTTGSSPAKRRALDWVIVGGESGARDVARPFNLTWARETVRACREAGVAVFVKQLGTRPATIGSTLVPLRLKHRKGEDMNEWPADLRVREWPRSTDEGASRGGAVLPPTLRGAPSSAEARR